MIKGNEELMESLKKEKRILPFQILLVITQHKARVSQTFFFLFNVHSVAEHWVILEKT